MRVTLTSSIGRCSEELFHQCSMLASLALDASGEEELEAQNPWERQRSRTPETFEILGISRTTDQCLQCSSKPNLNLDETGELGLISRQACVENMVLCFVDAIYMYTGSLISYSPFTNHILHLPSKPRPIFCIPSLNNK